MTANVDPKTGISYGLMDARNLQYLWQEIVDNGEDETQKDWEDETKKNIRDALSEFNAEDIQGGSAETRSDWLLEYWKHEIGQYVDVSKSHLDDIASDIVDLMDVQSGTFDIRECEEAVYDYLQQNTDYFQGDGDSGEHQYSYQDGNTHYGISALGGAPLIWIFKSDFATFCRAGSPCVPNAGDLDNCTDETHGNCVAYCPPLDEFCCDDNKENWPECIWGVQEDGTLGACVWRKPDDDSNEE